ncbi:Sua5/YciO/YrdC/YwlC family protein [Halioxenophilus sp. WMMB6]|uniref:Sua5/YciO/YrdC/YwlC family protein n=1 Tax=Halioxenophilus sp. WMMB6 TaxID=3073815 RepID=UPI00295E530D|nr:Sua5/YciO/YrdC/YwlC family protein [Halioxenophilus sp. WMMB6]
MDHWLYNTKVIHAARALQQGSVIAYPTEGVWGLGCDPANEQALLKILLLKNRPINKGVILVAANIGQFTPYLAGLSDAERATLAASWPGPNTWVIPHNGFAPSWIRGDHQSLAVRVSDHPVVAALCHLFGGPIVSTSANPGGLPPARTPTQVRRYYRNEPIVYAPGSVGSNGQPTQIRDLRSGQILRSA